MYRIFQFACLLLHCTLFAVCKIHRRIFKKKNRPGSIRQKERERGKTNSNSLILKSKFLASILFICLFDVCVCVFIIIIIFKKHTHTHRHKLLININIFEEKENASLKIYSIREMFIVFFQFRFCFYLSVCFRLLKIENCFAVQIDFWFSKKKKSQTSIHNQKYQHPSSIIQNKFNRSINSILFDQTKKWKFFFP